MPRPKSAEKRVRLNLEFVSSIRQRIERLLERTGAASMTEVIVRAIDVLYEIVVAKFSGAKIVIRDADGTEREVIFI
jgi:hypothetical protein